MNKLLPAIIIAIVTVLTFFKVFTLNEFPYPGNLLVSFNYPWYSGGWEGYDSWTTHKEFIAMDAIRQHIPWHKLTFSELSNNLQLPLWNPYNFSGFPHLGNLQSYIFNPFNFLFLILPLFEAWIIFIIVQIPLTIFFTYLFTRSIDLSKAPSLLSGIAFAFSSYFINWVEIGIVGHSVIWMPLMLFSIEKFIKTNSYRFLLLLVAASSFNIFSGHIQTSVFIFLTSVTYGLFSFIKSSEKKKIQKASIFFLFWLFLTGSITAIQTLPALELYLQSPLSKPLAKEVFLNNVMPLKNIITLLAPDFFGNPAVNNFWSVMYGDATPHIGVLPLLFATFAIIFSKRWEAKYFFILAIVFFLYAINSPLSFLLERLNLPFLTGTTAARSMFVFAFALSVLSAIGLEHLLVNKNDMKKFLYIIAAFSVLYASIFMFILITTNLSANAETVSKLLVSKRNMYLPMVTFTLFAFSFLISTFLFKKRKFLNKSWIVILFVLTVFSGIYQFNKSQPTSPKKFFFPNHPVFSWIKNNADINRFQGEGTAKTWNNISSYYDTYSAEGYGVFRVGRYAELFASLNSGSVPNYYERSTAEFSDNSTNRKKRLYNLLGVKYITYKDDEAVHTDEKPDDDVTLAWSEGVFSIYERTKVLPRFWITSSYIVIKNESEIINKIYDDSFDLKTLILENEPNINIIPNLQKGTAILDKYSPNNISFKINNPNNSLFFLSDTFYSGWNAYIDGKKTPIMRAHYSFRAVPLPANSSSLEFRYEPLSFKFGSIASSTGLIVMFLSILILKKKAAL